MIIKIFIKKYLKRLTKETFDEIKELTDEINQNDLTYYFKGNTFKKDLIISMMVQNFLKKYGQVNEARRNEITAEYI